MTKNFFVVGLPDNLLICLAFFGIAQRRGPLPELVGPFSPSSSPKLVNVTKNHDVCIFGVIIHYHFNHNYHHFDFIPPLAQNIIFYVRKRGTNCPDWG